MIDLLHRIKFPKGSLPPEGAVGILPFTVNPETAPFLVTSSKGLVWVSQAGTEGTVNAAFRVGCTPSQLYREVLQAVIDAGRQFEWGNIHPLTGQGIKAAVAHVRSYEPEDTVVLTAPGMKVSLSDGTSVQSAPWVPADTVVVLPKQREYVGAWGRVSRKNLVGVVHNAARGIAIATGGPHVDVSGERPQAGGADPSS